jgi:hypothetical protein
MLGEFVGEPLKDIDWSDIWETVSAVNAEEWSEAVAELKSEYQRTRNMIAAVEDWSAGDRFGIVIGIITHSAYHLGEIRQALCTLRG